MGGVPTAPTAGPAPQGLTLAQIKQMGGTPVSEPTNALGQTEDQVQTMVNNDPIHEAAEAGIDQIKEGSEQANKGTTEFSQGDTGTGAYDVGAGMLHSALGGIATAAAPISSIFSILGKIPTSVPGINLGDAVNKSVDSSTQAIQNDPTVQNFVTKYPGAVQLIPDLINAASLYIGADKAPEIKTAVENAGSTASELGSAAVNKVGETIAPVADAVNSAANTVSDALPNFSPTAQDVIAKRTSALQELADRYTRVGDVVNDAQGRNFDPIADIAQDDSFIPEIDKEGSVDSSQAIKKLNDFIKPLAQTERQAIEAEGVSSSFDKFSNTALQAADKYIDRGASYKNIVSRIQSDMEVYKENYGENGTIPDVKLDDIKNAKYKIVNWNNEDAQIADKIVAKAARDTIISDTKNADIKGLNDVMSRYYTARDFLDAIDSKKIKGGRLGKYFAQTLGGMAGSHFGPLGTLVGAYVADTTHGKILQTKFNPVINNGIELKTPMPDILKKTQDTLNQAPKQLPSKT